MDIYHAMSLGRAIIMSVQESPFAGHVVVIRGMGWSENGSPILYVNDPMNFFTELQPFEDILPYWKVAIVVY